MQRTVERSGRTAQLLRELMRVVQAAQQTDQQDHNDFDKLTTLLLPHQMWQQYGAELFNRFTQFHRGLLEHFHLSGGPFTYMTTVKAI
jgi:hypothetical protein